jgi:hypothetical protein
MANFSDKITLVLDVVTGRSSSSPLKGIRDDIDQTDGAFSKFKVGASGALDAVKANAGLLAAGAGAAIAGFAVKAVGDFQVVALAAGKFSEATGVSTEDASRFIEVAQDFGIGADAIEKSIGFMNRTLGQTPEKFAAAGVEIAKTKDGATDVTGTFENVIRVLNGIKDPAERAATAQQLLGRSWMESAELIGLGADGVKKALEGVEDAKVMSPEQVAQARRFRDTMDELQGVVESFTLEVGGELVPILSDLGGAIIPIVEAFGALRDAIQSVEDVPIAGWIATGMIGPLALGQRAVGALGDAWGGLREAVTTGSEDLNASVAPVLEFGGAVETTTGWLGKNIDAMREVDATAEEHAAAKKAAEQAEKDHAAAIQATIDRLREEAAALDKQRQGMRNAADATIASEDAQRGFAEAVADSSAKQADATVTTEDREAAIRAEREAAIDAADAAVALGQKQAEASGKTTTATQDIGAFNTSLLANARYATPAARDAITDYIIEANNIPESESTDIRAAIARGDFDTAAVLLAGLSEAREAAIVADAKNVQATDNELDAIAEKSRTAVIKVVSKIVGGMFAKGGRVGSQGGMGGEAGPELVELNGRQALIDKPTMLPPGAMVTPLSAGGTGGGTGLAAATGGGGVGGGGSYSITVNAGMGTNGAEVGRQVVDAIKKYERANGAGWRRTA